MFIIVHVRKRNSLVNGPIITADYHSKSENTKRKTKSTESKPQQNLLWSSSSHDPEEENKHVRPYFLIRPQATLLLPNEIGILIETN